MKPESLNKLIRIFNDLPGIGKKQAERIAYFILKDDFVLSEDLEDALKLARRNLNWCEECGHVTEEQLCDICTSKSREKKLVIVESSIDVFKFEETDTIKPYYHVLHGLMDVKNSRHEMNIKNLVERAKKYKEVIIALSPNLEGIVTSNYLKELIGSEVKITQLAQGIPLGAAMEYVDGITLKAAMENRKEVK